MMISITAVSVAQLNQTASKNLEELQGVVPGVTIPAATAYGGSSIVIRGRSLQPFDIVLVNTAAAAA